MNTAPMNEPPGHDGRHTCTRFRCAALLIAGLFVSSISATAQNETAISDGKAAEKPAAEVPAINFRVLKAWELNLGDHSIRYNRVAPPVLPEQPPPTPSAPPPTAEEIAAAKAAWDREPHKKYEILFLSATVYDHKVTEVRWYGGKREFRVFSNIDFNYLRGLGSFETEDTVYTLLMGIGDETTESVTEFNQYAAERGFPKKAWKNIPAVETFSRTRSEFAVVEDKVNGAPAEEDLTALDALHVYYDANKQRLIEESVKLQAANEERARWLKEHPPVPKDTVINYWKKTSAPASTTILEDKR